MTGTPSLARRAGLALAVAAASAMLLAACGTTPTASSSQQRTTHPTAATSAVSGTALTTIDGTTVQVPSSKPSVLVFISISCADCSAAAKAVAQASHTVGDKANFLAVDLDPGVPTQDLKSFLAYVHAKNLPTMIDQKAALLAKYQVSALSSVLVINPAGKVTYRAVNPTPAAITGAVGTAS